jgi:hypothetical protein
MEAVITIKVTEDLAMATLTMEGSKQPTFLISIKSICLRNF